jgi:hypothetical protein
MALTTVNPSMIGQTATGASSLTATGSAAASLITAAGTALSADSSGRVTMPAQPAFLAGINSASDATFTLGQFLPFNITQTNIGNNFNTSTNRFTAPVTGRYCFSYGMLFTNSGGNTQSMQAAIAVNGSYPTGGDAYSVLACTPNSLGGTIALTSTVVFNLAAGDVVGISNRSSNNLRIYQGHTYFSGYLIG